MMSSPKKITMMRIKAILCLFLAATAFSAFSVSPLLAAEPLKPIASLDLPRYLGSWYEVAKYPNRFQKNCASNTKATYSALPDGTVQVLNRCTQRDSTVGEAIGQARQPGSVVTSPKLEVRFAPAWLSFFPLVWGNYWVIDLDTNYQLAAVSEPEREFLWVLSRIPTVDAKAYADLLGRLEKQGFDIKKLELTPQGKAASTAN